MVELVTPSVDYVRTEAFFFLTYIYGIFGAIVLILNLPLAIYLLSTVNRNQKELILIIALSVSDLLSGAQFMTMGIHRYLIWFDEVHFISRFSCDSGIILTSYLICIQTDNLFYLVIALDRLYAVLFPIRYGKMGTCYTYLLISTPFILAFVGYLVHLLIVYSQPPVYIDEICFFVASFLPKFLNFLSLQRMLCVAIPILIYFFIFIRLRMRWSRHSNSVKMGKGMKHLTMTVTYTTLVAVFLVFAPEAWSFFKLFGGFDANTYFILILFKLDKVTARKTMSLVCNIMYTNQTAEELDKQRCTSQGKFLALTSFLMRFNYIFTFSIIFLTIFMSFKAVKLLIKRNIFSNSTRILLLSILFNANLYQLNMFEIRTRSFYRSFVYSNEPCQIEFHSSECFLDQTIYSFTNVLYALLIFCLTIDRFISLQFSKFYEKINESLAIFCVLLSIITAILINIWQFSDIPLVGYVPQCFYSPQLGLNRFDDINNYTIIFIMFNLFITLSILCGNLRKDRLIRTTSFDTKSKYQSFESLQTTKSICTMIFTQFLFLSLLSISASLIRHFESSMSEQTFHEFVPFIIGVVYGNLSIPCLIIYKTNQVIENRRKSIGSMTTTSHNVDSHMHSLKSMWA
ncbi:unnamed protein product [Caenorhabditis angaria]|uniref:G-protein coupled receptors family 1 profile domain-containing protein n=1 Tax=Caenorhabditis angaria TaxID=860376 RepID=A0A9P1MY79_9PELO|nr:unnamed protein product [Caenorhabditis angaria]